MDIASVWWPSIRNEMGGIGAPSDGHFAFLDQALNAIKGFIGNLGASKQNVDIVGADDDLYYDFPDDVVPGTRQEDDYDLWQSDAMNEYYEHGYYDENANDDFVYQYDEEMPFMPKDMESEPEAQEDQIKVEEMDDRVLVLDADEV